MKKTIVIKIGGSPLEKDSTRRILLKNISRISPAYRIVIVHGGKYLINRFLEKLRIRIRFVQGQRYTGRKALGAVRMALGHVNRMVTDELNMNGCHAAGLSGIYGKILRARRISSLGYVGKITRVNSALIESLTAAGITPVIYPVCSGRATALNVNADSAASEIAAALGAEHLIFISDVPGVLDGRGRVIRKIRSGEVSTLKKKRVVTGGMIPKLEGCMNAIRKGVVEIHITDTVKFSGKTVFSRLPGTRITR